MTIYRSLILVLLLAPVMPVATAETETQTDPGTTVKIFDEGVLYHVKLVEEGPGDKEFSGRCEEADDRFAKFILDEPGYDKPGQEKRRTVKKSEVDWSPDSTYRETPRKRNVRWLNDYNLVPVTMADGSEGWMNPNEVDLAKRAFEKAAEFEATQAPPTMPEKPAVDTASEEEAQQPGALGLWTARIILVVVAAAIVGVLLKTMVLTNPE